MYVLLNLGYSDVSEYWAAVSVPLGVPFEPGEPRWRQAKPRTPSSKPGVRKQETEKTRNPQRTRNYKRGIRSEDAANRRREKHLTKQSEERR